MANIAKLLTEHMAIWTAADTEKKSGRGRASGNAGSVYGVKKLRELILELAVRGKLVQQDPNDEPASELLKRIQAEKAKLIAEGKLKKVKSLAPIGEDEKPFELPNGWEWTRLNDIAPQSLIDGDWIESKDQDINGEVRLIQLADVGVSEFKNASDRYVNNVTFTKLNCFEIKKNDILIARLPSPIGRACIFPGLNTKAITVVDVAVLRTNGFIDNQYVVNAINSKTFVDQVESFGKGATRFRISTGNLKELLLPVAPSPEQHRIVAKVDELMALCDQLEQQHSNAQEAHETLVSQLLATLTQSQNAAEFNANWQRIYAHFDVLFTTEASIDALKQTLLQLAVMGKLVPQDPNDEPASELLKRIQAEKAKLIAEGKHKKEKSLTPIGEDEKPFDLPEGWEWVRVSNLAEIKGGKRLPEGKSFSQVETSNIYIQVTNMKNGTVIEESLKYVDDEAKELLKNYTISSDDLYITIAGTIGDVGTIPSKFNGMILTENAAKIVFNILDKNWFKYCFSSNFLRNQFQEKTIQLAQPKLALHRIASSVIALPPLKEQHRIVAKVDVLMALCDQLKTHIQQANQQQQIIANALVAQALKPATAEIIDLAAYRAAITCNIIKRMQHNQAFGRTFAMKLLYLSQQHIGFETYLEFEREAAGPFDQWIYDFERDGIAAGWFESVKKPLSNGHTKIEYQVKSAIDEPVAFMSCVGSTEQRKELDRLFALFADKKTEDAEIVATLFAAWNDFLLSGVSPTDEQITQEVREQWHPAKAKFTPEQLKQWLDWLRNNNIVPTGKGTKTIYQQNLLQ